MADASVAERVPVLVASNPLSARDLRTKGERMEHDVPPPPPLTSVEEANILFE